MSHAKVAAAALAIGIAGGFFLGVYASGSDLAVDYSGQAFKMDRSALNQDNVLVLINEARLEAGLRQVAVEPQISDMSQVIADEISSSGECTHRYIDQMRSEKVLLAEAVSENLSCNQPDAVKAVDNLLASPTHRQVLLDPDVDRLGIGIAGDDLALHFLTAKKE